MRFFRFRQRLVLSIPNGETSQCLCTPPGDEKREETIVFILCCTLYIIIWNIFSEASFEVYYK